MYSGTITGIYNNILEYFESKNDYSALTKVKIHGTSRKIMYSVIFVYCGKAILI